MSEYDETVREDEDDAAEDTEAHGAGLTWNENVTVVEDIDKTEADS